MSRLSAIPLITIEVCWHTNITTKMLSRLCSCYQREIHFINSNPLPNLHQQFTIICFLVQSFQFDFEKWNLKCHSDVVLRLLTCGHLHLFMILGQAMVVWGFDFSRGVRKMDKNRIYWETKQFLPKKRLKRWDWYSRIIFSQERNPI